MKSKRQQILDWRRDSLAGQRADIVAGRRQGPEPPRPWALLLRRLIDASRAPVEYPSWWTPANAYVGSVETRTDPHSYRWDGITRASKRDEPFAVFQFTFAGLGMFELYGRAPQRVQPGTGFCALVPSRHRYYLPEESPGWTFAWVAIYHPYLVRRIAKQLAATGPLFQATPASPFIRRLVRLTRGAFHKDFRDRFAVEQALFAFALGYERLAHVVPDREGERLLADLRSRVLAAPRRRIGIELLAREHGMSASAFGHHFRARTGFTPARFMTQARVQLAARLLETTRLPLARIADECGFANVNHFGKVFRRFQQQAAGSYRRSFGGGGA